MYVFPDIGSKVLSSLRLKRQKSNEKYDANGIFLAKHNKIIKDFAIIGNYNNYYCTYKFSNSVDKISVFQKSTC